MIQRQLRFCEESLARQMEALASQLSQTARLLKADANRVVVSSLGEIQSRGTIIDAECGRVAAYRDALAMALAAEIAAEKEQP